MGWLGLIVKVNRSNVTVTLSSISGRENIEKGICIVSGVPLRTNLRFTSIDPKL
jgi:hypothetical protein